jgi:hypothetical protein
MGEGEMGDDGLEEAQDGYLGERNGMMRAMLLCFGEISDRYPARSR